MPEDDNVVVPFPRRQFEGNSREAAHEELPVRTRRGLDRKKVCDHNRHGSWVDERARTVTCRGCGIPLDPIAVLTSFARSRESLIDRGRALRQEVDHLTDRVARLKRDETNAKSRIRTARRRRGDRDAIVAAAQAKYRSDGRTVSIAIGGYRPWEELSKPQREVVVGYVERIVEEYLGALDARRETA